MSFRRYGNPHLLLQSMFCRTWWLKQIHVKSAEGRQQRVVLGGARHQGTDWALCFHAGATEHRGKASDRGQGPGQRAWGWWGEDGQDNGAAIRGPSVGWELCTLHSSQLGDRSVAEGRPGKAKGHREAGTRAVCAPGPRRAGVTSGRDLGGRWHCEPLSPRGGSSGHGEAEGAEGARAYPENFDLLW